jgi:hypothetical protein
MLAYWERDCEWMGDGLQLAICPSFTGPTGLAALDVSGRPNHGTLTNMDRNTAWVTGGLNFDGSNDVVTIAQPQYVYPLSINFWVRITAVHNAYVLVFTNGTTTDASFGFVSNQQDLRIGSQTSLAGNLSLGVLSNWTMLTFVLTSPTSRSMFINGMPNGIFTASASLPTMSSLRFGGGDFGSRKLNGLSDDLRVYNRSLTAAEIRQMYERDRGGGMLHQPPTRRSYYAQLAAAFSILAESGSYALTGQPIPLLYGRVLPADTGSVLLSGQTTPLLASRLLNADQGSYAYTGTDAATLLGRLLDAGAAAYTLDGTAAGFLASRRISADTVAYQASGLDVGFLRSRVLEAGPGQYVLVASPVNLQTGTPGTGGAAPYYYLFLLGGSR